MVIFNVPNGQGANTEALFNPCGRSLYLMEAYEFLTTFLVKYIYKSNCLYRQLLFHRNISQSSSQLAAAQLDSEVKVLIYLYPPKLAPPTVSPICL